MKFSIERQINPEHPANKLGKYPFANYFFGNVKAVEAMDDVDGALRAEGAARLVPAVLVAPAASIVSPTAVREVRRRLRAQPGRHRALQVTRRWERGQRVVLEKNPTYWR